MVFPEVIRPLISARLIYPKLRFEFPAGTKKTVTASGSSVRLLDVFCVIIWAPSLWDRF